MSTRHITLTEPISALQLPKIPKQLLTFALFQQIQKTTCQVRLNQRRYGIVSSERMLTLKSSTHESELYLCLLNSILFTMVNDPERFPRAERSCINGFVQIVVYQSQVVHEASWWNIVNQQSCDLIYVPISVTEVANREQVQEAIQSRREKKRWFCATCRPGHAMGLFVDRKRRTIQVYDSNGTISNFYRYVVDWLERRLSKNSTYRVLQDPELPQFGIQTNTGIAMCGYFSALYAALRLTEPQVSALELNRLLLEIDRSVLFSVLNQWHCYMLVYAKTSHVLDMFEQAPSLFERAFNRLINAHIYLRHLSPKQLEERWKMMDKLKYISNVDLQTATQMLESI